MVKSSYEEPQMSREFNVIIERDSEGFYVGSVPSLRGATRRRGHSMN